MAGNAPNTDIFAPRYLIAVEGTSVASDITPFISAVEYEEERSAASKITLEVLNQNFRFLDERVFAEGNVVDLWIGYAGKPLHFMNRGFIIAPEPRFPRGGIPTLSVTAYDLSFNLMRTGAKDRGRVYSKQTDSDIAAAIFREEGIAPFVFGTKGKSTRVRKKGKSRWEFLLKLAKLHNFTVGVNWDPVDRLWLGYFGPPDAPEQATRHRFVYGTGEPDATLLEFDPRSNLTSQSTEVEVVWTDPKTRKHHRIRCEVKRKDAERTRFTAAVGTDKLREGIPNGPSVTITCLGQREECVADRSFSSAADAKRWAAAWFDARQREFIQGRGTIVGSPDVRLGQVHAFEGLGPRLSGDWALRRVRHRLEGSSLYETEFDAEKKVLDSVVGAPESPSSATGEEEAA